jgi:hypothetical protein
MNDLTFNELPKAVSQLFDKLNSIEKILLSQGNNQQSETDKLLTIKQAGDLLSLKKLIKKHSRRSNYKYKSKKHNYFPKFNRLLKLLIQLFIIAHLVLGSLEQTLPSISYKGEIIMLHERREQLHQPFLFLTTQSLK